MTKPHTYDANKKHAVVQVQNSGNLIPKENVDVTYNAFNKVATVTKGSTKLSITYGTDHQRTKTVLVNNGVTTTTLYTDNYEQRTASGVTTTYHYVASPDGLAAVYVKSGNTATAYYIETDHLGSIVRAYDYIGNIKFSAAYDAWGNQTISKNDVGITRGYTGHEHWNVFGLIDMNGRFYDPLLGRFLSPDPYVQAPANPQNFNRYSYCLNNPLKYTDPSGEWILTWGINKSGFSLGLNFAPYPVGFGINVDWSNGFSLGVYGEFGERAGGNGLGAGIYADQGFSYNFKEHEWSTFASEGAYGSAGPFSVGGSYNQNYNITNNKFDDYFSVNAGLGWGGNNYGYSFGVNYTFGDNGGWSWSFGGNLVYEAEYINETTYSAQLKEGIPTQLESDKYCYAYTLAYADAGHGNHDAQYFVDVAGGAYGADVTEVAVKADLNVHNAGCPKIGKKAIAYESLGKQIRAGKECYGAIGFESSNHWVNITSVTMADKSRVFGSGYKRVAKSTTIWNPIGGHMRGPRSFLKIGSLF